MAIKERINPKTKKKEYKVRYYFMADGKKRDSETGWFSTKEKAEREAKLLKERKEKEDRNKVLERRDKKLITVYEEYLQYLKKEADKNISNTDKSIYRCGTAIYSKHFPLELQNMKINELSVFNFKSWLSYINAKEELSGGCIREYKKLLIKFNIWLSHNNYYIDENLEEMIDIGLRRVKIKAKTVGNREAKGERNIVDIIDFRKITYYYYKKGIEEFRNFYYYTLFYIFFFSGLRVEEVCGLQWKFIDLRDSQRTISVRNTISRNENKIKALERVAEGNYRTKNNSSVRILPIFNFYYELLLDYKQSYKYKFNLSNEEIEECFVFPNICKNDPHLFFYSGTILGELNRVCEEVGIKKTDLQMFRHSCAMFLILPPPNGLGFTEENVKDYFGHTDTSMLERVYAKLNTYQKSDRLKGTFNQIYTPSLTDDKTKEEALKLEMIERMSGDNEKAQKSRKIRIIKQIKKAIAEGREVYYYYPKDKDIIEEYAEMVAKKYGKAEDRIAFIEENIE